MNPRSSGGVTGDPLGALKSKSTWTDEDGVGQVKRDGCLKGLAEAGHALTPRESEGTWQHHEACVQAKQSRQDGVFVRCVRKEWDQMPLCG